MQFNPKALLVLIGFGALMAIALSSDGSAWVYVAEALVTVVVLLGVAGFLREQRTGRSKAR